MITTLVLNQETLKFQSIEDPDEINNLCSTPRRIIWVDVADPTSQDFDELAQEFGFHHLSIEDCRNEHQRPKVEEYQGYYFIVLNGPDLVLTHQPEHTHVTDRHEENKYG